MKILLTVFSMIALLLRMQLIGYMAGVAADTTMPGTDVRGLRSPLVVHAASGLLVLLATAGCPSTSRGA